MTRLLSLIALALAAGACREAEPVTPASSVSRPASPPGALPPGPTAEVFRLEPGDPLVVTGRVPTPEARAGLLAEVARRFPGRPPQAELVVDPDVAGSWVPEAVALLPFVAQIAGGGLVVAVEAGRAGGGTLTLTGRIESDSALARLAADAGATVAPPFVIRTNLVVGLAPDSTAAGGAGSARPPPPSVEAGPGAEAAARAVREALGDSAVAFVPGAAALTPPSAATLGRAGAALTAQPGVQVEVAVGPEGTGSASLDRALALRRAEAVRARLVAAGAAPAQVVVTEEPPETPGVRLRVTRVAVPETGGDE